MTFINRTATRFLCLTLTCFLSSLAFPAAADQVTPSDRVTTRVKVRELADGQSTRIGSLELGETAEFLESVPHWYHVRLNDGTAGFVSKSWTDLVPGPVVTTSTIRLGSWNIKKLGHGDSTNFPKVADIIEDNFDILGIVEVMQKEQNHPGYDALLAALGSGWSGRITDSPRPKTTSSNSEFYAILYKNNLVEPCSGWNTLVFFQDNDGSDTGTGANKFQREPAYGCFEAPAGTNEVSVDFLLGVYHAVWGSGDTYQIKEEVDHIDDVFIEMASAKPGEKDIFIAGDFNLKPDQIMTVVSVEVATEGTGSTVNSSGERTANLYDHILIHDPTASSELQGSPKVLDVMNTVANGQIYYSQISDHLPVVVELRDAGSDDD